MDMDKNEISDGMIENARRHPIVKIIEFNAKGFAKCFAHEERTPSLHRYERGNVGHCFSCAKTFDPISILMLRDGLTFADAIRALQ